MLAASGDKGRVSRIACSAESHPLIALPRHAADIVVTEYGVAYLHGKSIRERAKALIEIAHPKFQDELYAYCEKTKWLQRPQAKEPVAAR